MEHDLYNEKSQYQKLVPIIVPKINISEITPYKQNFISKGISNLDDLDLGSLSTHKNSADSLNSLNSNKEKEIPLSLRLNCLNLKQNLANIFAEEPKKRRDNFGKEIKKGGKQKIAFADDLDIIKSLIPETGRQNKKRKSVRIQNDSQQKNVNSQLADIKMIKRSNSFINNRTSIMKNIYNITKINTKTKKKYNEAFVQIIDVENLKKENKLNTFSIKNRKVLAEEENVCCSCYCSIW